MIVLAASSAYGFFGGGPSEKQVTFKGKIHNYSDVLNKNLRVSFHWACFEEKSRYSQAGAKRCGEDEQWVEVNGDGTFDIDTKVKFGEGYNAVNLHFFKNSKKTPFYTVQLEGNYEDLKKSDFNYSLYTAKQQTLNLSFTSGRDVTSWLKTKEGQSLKIRVQYLFPDSNGKYNPGFEEFVDLLNRTSPLTVDGDEIILQGDRGQDQAYTVYVIVTAVSDNTIEDYFEEYSELTKFNGEMPERAKNIILTDK